eukprot:TRINITY_DN24024_c0_g1_i1.p1 TRINITY_DN24024_c0_g1~~TRINITY_DN24024_c0_g1_i1.p1  ORF type:complete len:100 (-),score=19.93 TRINITY_DN24024_c0_g1_i1:50-349(-)
MLYCVAVLFFFLFFFFLSCFVVSVLSCSVVILWFSLSSSNEGHQLTLELREGCLQPLLLRGRRGRLRLYYGHVALALARQVPRVGLDEHLPHHAVRHQP